MEICKCMREHTNTYGSCNGRWWWKKRRTKVQCGMCPYLLNEHGNNKNNKEKQPKTVLAGADTQQKTITHETQ